MTLELIVFVATTLPDTAWRDLWVTILVVGGGYELWKGLGDEEGR